MSLSQTYTNERWRGWIKAPTEKQHRELAAFVRETNKIEGIVRTPAPRELSAHAILLGKETLNLADLQQFVSGIQPGAKLRQATGMNVRVGPHKPPPGGEGVVIMLDQLMASINGDSCPWWVHNYYESLHPFTDGNGRSGRALWLWMMGPHALEIGFLHRFYYQSLQAWDGRNEFF